MRKWLAFLWFLLFLSAVFSTQSAGDTPKDMRYNVNVGDTHIYNCTKHIMNTTSNDHGFVEIDDFSKAIVTNGTTFVVKVTKILDTDILGVREYKNQSYVGSIAHFITKVAKDRSYYEELIALDDPLDSIEYKLINDTFYRSQHEVYYATGYSIEEIIQNYGWNWKTGWLEYEYQKYSMIKTDSRTLVELEYIALSSTETETKTQTSTTMAETTKSYIETDLSNGYITNSKGLEIISLCSLVSILVIRRRSKTKSCNVSH
ncbi:MAG: hypothetical protein JSV04_12240 [Candidatus Heimdallarchaeota archaeon]|nr:MAG: hypothetical protein JSV04_12240 [Candidatus Heimdallarchaeota archaeon]